MCVDANPDQGSPDRLMTPYPAAPDRLAPDVANLRNIWPVVRSSRLELDDFSLPSPRSRINRRLPGASSHGYSVVSLTVMLSFYWHAQADSTHTCHWWSDPGEYTTGLSCHPGLFRAGCSVFP